MLTFDPNVISVAPTLVTQTISEYLTKKVLPALKDKHGEHLLREFVKRGENHTIMNKWHQKFFMYLVSTAIHALLYFM